MGGNIDKSPPARHMKPQFFAEAFHLILLPNNRIQVRSAISTYPPPFLHTIQVVGGLYVPVQNTGHSAFFKIEEMERVWVKPDLFFFI